MAYIEPTPESNSIQSQRLALKTRKKKGFNLSDPLKLILALLVVTCVAVPFLKISIFIAVCEVIFVVICGVTGGVMAKHKNNAFNGFVLGLAFGPIGLVMAAYLTDRTREPCTRCKELIKKNARVCPFCGVEK